MLCYEHMQGGVIRFISLYSYSYSCPLIFRINSKEYSCKSTLASKLHFHIFAKVYVTYFIELLQYSGICEGIGSRPILFGTRRVKPLQNVEMTL